MFAIFRVKDKFLRFSNPSLAKVYYKDRVEDILNNECIYHESFIDKFYKSFNIKELYDHVEKGFQKPKTWFLFYELGHILNETKVQNDIESNTILCIEAEFEKIEEVVKSEIDEHISKGIQLELTSKPDKQKYKSNFNLIQSQLKEGNTYQVNYTEKFEFRFTGDLNGLVWRNLTRSQAAYAHYLYIPELRRAYLSQTPECLFQLGKVNDELKIETFPIKGTIKNTSCASALLDNAKEQGELYMISDLLRNDLNRLGKPNTKLLKKKGLLRVPGLIHQFSHLEKTLDRQIEFYEIAKSLFPGGSITGAPKKKTMEIISNIEKRDRGFYCGSTILNFGKCSKASINIRSAEINLDKNILEFQSGGGITLLSESDNEYDEMISKMRSFHGLFHNNSSKSMQVIKV